MRLDNCAECLPENVGKIKGISASAVCCGILLYPLANFAMNTRTLTLSYVNIIMNLLHVALGKGEKLFCRVKKVHITRRLVPFVLCLQVRGIMRQTVNHREV
jgi:hypothetical protein